MPTKQVFVHRKKSRGQHAWVFSNEVERTEGNPGPGDTVLVHDKKRFLGSGVYNPFSLIRVRLYSEKDEELDQAFIKGRIEAALAYRRTMLPGENDFRLLYGESDRMPGLVIDKYGEHFVVQTYCVALDQRLELVVAALREIFNVASVFEKNDFRLREPEGLPRRERVIFGTSEARTIISENGARFIVDIGAGQKTGYYFDHRMTRRKVRQMADSKNVLDVFSYTGSFAVHAALGGANRVLGIDASAPACAIAADNARLNNVGEKCEFATANAFNMLYQMAREGQKYDLVLLDPPAFIKNAREKEGGMRGYRQINASAMKLLAEGGTLVSSSCSHYLFWQDMLDMLVGAAQDAGRTFTILDRCTQGPDHPVLLSMNESEYLRCFILHVS